MMLRPNSNRQEAMWRTRIVRVLLLLLLPKLVVVGVGAVVLSHSHDNDDADRPVMHTYWEPAVPDDDTNDWSGMSVTDHQPWLEFWTESWRAAGWRPIVLTQADAAGFVLEETTATATTGTTTLSEKNPALKVGTLSHLSSPNTRMLLHKWMAMSAGGGGWYCDYDVFPLISAAAWEEQRTTTTTTTTSSTSRKATTSTPQQQQPANDDILTLHETVAPTLVSGSAQAWRQMTVALMEHAKVVASSLSSSYHHSSSQQQQQPHAPNNLAGLFWTDTLALLDIRHDGAVPMKTTRSVRQADASWLLLLGNHHNGTSHNHAAAAAATTRNTTTTIPSSTSRCPKLKPKQWVVHFGPLTLQRSSSVPSHWRLPKHRLTLARLWMQQWMDLCGWRTTNFV
jgi:hypothetical protein